jgi:MinD-like ATPase involved in chromosome partitioning or flagellar assembly
MLRRMSAEQSPAEEPANPDTPPAPAPPAADPVAPPGPVEQPPVQPQPPVQQPPPGYYPPPPQQAPYPEQPYPDQQQYYPPQPPPQPPYPPQGYPPYQPGPYDQQQYPPPPPPGQVAPYQPAPYEQYPPPYQPYPPYEQQAPYEPPPYPEPQYQDPQYQPYPQPQYQEPQYPPHQQHPGQAPYQPGPPPAGPDAGWGPPPMPQSDQIGTPMPSEQEGDSVFRRFRRIASEAAFLVGASGRMQRDVDNIATTVTALLSTMLTAQRSDRVVAVDADPSGAELSRRLELSFGAGPIEGVTLVRSEGNAEAIRTTLAEVQGQGARDVGLALVDCPGTMYDEISTEMASSGHCTVLVVPSVQHVANYCLAQLDQLTPEGQDVLLTRGVVVITIVENQDPGSVSWLADAFRQRGLDPIVLPYDAHVARSWPLHSEELQAETRRAVLDLAARVVETVTRTTS